MNRFLSRDGKCYAARCRRMPAMVFDNCLYCVRHYELIHRYLRRIDLGYIK